MAQHDYVIANASGATVRADINNMALAISSNNSGSSEPSTTYAYEWWIDTGNNLLKLRNSANNAWITMPFSITANNTVDINGGTIDGAVIGGSSAAAGTFTTFTSNGIDDNADATAITIDSSENVGISETTPLAKLHIKRGDSGLSSINAAGDHIFLENTGANGTGITLASGNTSNGSIIFGDEDSNYRGVLIYDHSADAMKFVTAATERMRLNSDGKLLVTEIAHITSGNLEIGNGDEKQIFSASSQNITFQIADTERLRIDSEGIKFNGDTNIANALNDYEEGTWTPNIVGTTGSAGTHALSASGSVNNYTKIGNRVYFQMSRYVTNKGSYSGKTKVTGLPFTNNGSTTAITMSLFPDADYPDTRMVVAQITGSTEIQFFDGARADVEHDWADLGTGYYLNCAGTYLTDS